MNSTALNFCRESADTWGVERLNLAENQTMFAAIAGRLASEAASIWSGGSKAPEYFP